RVGQGRDPGEVRRFGETLPLSREVIGRTMLPSPSLAAVPAPEQIVGPQPWFPWPLSRWRWWNAPVPAERLAALRIGVALILFLDILSSYLPLSTDYLSRGGIGDRALFNYRFERVEGKE